MTPAVAALLDFSGRRVIVTGASGGIGGDIARRLAEAGAEVIVHFHRNAEGAERVRDAIHAAGGRAVICQADLTAGDGIDRLMDMATADGIVDGVVNNAGIQPVVPFDALTAADVAAMLAANVAAPLFLTQAFARHRAQHGGGGAVVNIASIEGLQPAMFHAHYTSAKAALIMQTRNAALELGPQRTRVNAVSPGLIDAGGLRDGWPEGVARWEAAAPLTRTGTPEDIADAVLFLMSDGARWITGANLVVDGGVLSTNTW